ncbi:Sugar transporter ERD6-like 16 [Linum perenne]
MSIKSDVENNNHSDPNNNNNMKEPLIRKNIYRDEENRSSGEKNGSLWMVYFSTFVAVCGAYEFGCCVGFSSPTQDAIRSDLSLSLAEYSMFGSILTFGAMIGAATSGPLADLLGRKGVSFFSTTLTQKDCSLPFSRCSCDEIVECLLCSWLACYLLCSGLFLLNAYVPQVLCEINSSCCLSGILICCVLLLLGLTIEKGAVALDIGRLATGYGMGVFSYVVGNPVFVFFICLSNCFNPDDDDDDQVPVFISEIAPKNLRGALATLNQVMICCGASGCFIIGTFATWRTLALTGIVPCGVLLVGLMFMPESPRWLAKTSNEKDFEVALQKLRGKDADISNEADEIKEYIETLDRLPKVKLMDLFNKRYLKSVIIGVGLMVFQQFGGINGVCFYVSNIFKSAGFSPSVGTITYAILQVVVTLVVTQVIDRAGRKPLLLVSGSGLVLACLIIGLSFYLKVNELALHIVPMLAVTGLLLYIGSFSVGMGAVPWVIMSEIFPINIKGTAGGFATLVNWFGAWAVSYTYNFLMSWSSYGTFFLYAAVNALAIVFVIKVVPETKGRTLEQIQAAINE